LRATTPDHDGRGCEIAEAQSARGVVRVGWMHDLRWQEVVDTQSALIRNRDLVPG
jgi:hypothetical protein